MLTTNQTKPLESAVQEATSTLIGRLTTLEMGLTALVMLVSGPLSDRYGRKIFLVWNLSLLTATQLTFLLFHVFDIDCCTIWVYYITSCLFGLSGGSLNFCLIVFRHAIQ
jgi:MFS family permease